MPPLASKPSIVFLGTQMEVAGAQRMLLSQAKWFQERGYAVKAVFFYDKQDLGNLWQANNPFPVISLDGWKPGGGLRNLWRLPNALVRLFRMLRRDVDTLVTYTPHSNLLGLPLAWLAGVPARVGTHHGYIEGSSRWMARLHGQLTNSRLCSRMVAVSDQVCQYAQQREGAKPAKITVIENGINPLVQSPGDAGKRKAVRKSLGILDSDVLLLTVGRLTVQKGHTVLLDAVTQLGDAADGSRFVFAGEGPQRAKLEEQTVRLSLQDRVTFLGVRNDVADLLQAADVFVQPSLWEGLSLALLEALFAGLPVLATRVEGVVDVVEDGANAVLVPPENPTALADAIRRLAGDKALRQRIGKAGQARAQAHYSLDRMCSSYQSLFEELLNHAG